jgi:hypothetical protein
MTTTDLSTTLASAWQLAGVSATEEHLRSLPSITYPHLLSPFLPTGLTVLFGAAGSGKSMLAQQMEHCLAWGVPLGGLRPDHAVRCLIVDLEGNRILTQERSLDLLEFGSLPSDVQAPEADYGMIQYVYRLPGETLAERFAGLSDYLADAAASGRPFGYVRIDTMRLFLGANSRQVNAYEWDAMHLRQLGALAEAHMISIVLVHHPNKAGDVSGSVAVAGTATQVLKMIRTKGTYEGVLTCDSGQGGKNRVGPEFEYPMEMVNGKWAFTDRITAVQAKHRGAPRAVLDYLFSMPAATAAATKRDFMEATDLPEEAVKKALYRLMREGIVDFCDGVWTFSRFADLGRYRPDAPGVVAADQAASPETSPRPQPQAPNRSGEDLAGPEAMVDEEDSEEQEATPSAIQALKASITSSKKHPVINIRKEDRDSERWQIMTQLIDGRHRWKWEGAVADEETVEVVVLDDNGRYIAACSSVPVCANVPARTGPLDAYDPRFAGAYLIQPAPWRIVRDGAITEELEYRMGHPLGNRAERAIRNGERLWVPTPHMRFLAKRGQGWTGEIFDSVTGPAATNLFEDYYRWAHQQREAHRQDPEQYAATKRETSIALRVLWPKRARSPFWRPDYHQSMVAEANLRHWIAGAKAVEAGYPMVGMRNVDETVMLRPLPAPKDWVPETFTVGLGLGQVKIKEVLPFREWKARRAHIER